ncbi:MAG TPA: sugar O-acyltransferase, partial [Anaerolineae bacterium]|nr:sugar O-acyltransferase [Anaerolineae bacterium]
GTGGNCIDILDTLLDINDSQGKKIYQCVGFLDDNPEKWRLSFHGIKVLGPLQKAKELSDCFLVFGIGSVSNYWKRKEIFQKIEISEDRFETIIHPSASISRFAHINTGSVIFQNVTITSNAKIGKFVYVLPNSIISHDATIADFTCIAGSVCISGNVHVGQGCYIGSNSTIKDGLRIEDDCLIGMGSVVIRNIPENTVVIGNPANFLRNSHS